MGNFRSDNRGGSKAGFGGERKSFGSSGSRDRRGGGRSFGGRSGGRGGGFGGGRDSGGRSGEMHDVICSKCGKRCQVPFRPTGSKPVYCSDCFRNEGAGSNFNSREQDRPMQSNASSEKLEQINAKLDKILEILENLEITDEEDEDGEEDEEDSE